MELKQIRCAVAVADAMHFGRAARSLDMMPASLGRQVRLLEDELGILIFERTTRSVALTADGRAFLAEASAILERADTLVDGCRERGRSVNRIVRLGAIDSASAGLVPILIHDLHAVDPGVTVELIEDKSIRLLPKLLSGRLDLAVIRPPNRMDERLRIRFLLHETAVVALPATHPLASGDAVSVADLCDVAMIIPERGSRPHSHDVTMKLFDGVGLTPRIAQLAEEKQTILNMVAANIGAAIVPLWSTRTAIPGVAFLRLTDIDASATNRLPLSIAWQANVRNSNRDRLLDLLDHNLEKYALEA